MVKAAGESSSGYFKRVLTGTTFLGLEHTLHKLFLIIVASLVAAGLVQGLMHWLGEPSYQAYDAVDAIYQIASAAQLGNNSMVALVAALLVFAPFLVFFDRRVRAELVKRPGFQARLAYKLPLYTAMGVVALIKIGLSICALTVVLQSLVTLGQSDTATIGDMYRMQFLPAILGLVVFGSLGWYLLRLAQGRDYSRKFNAGLTVVALVLAIALLITATVNAQNTELNTPRTQPELKDYLQDYGLPRDMY